MKERPILFSAPMVRAILAGTKSQTRRNVKPQPETQHDGEPYWHVGGYRAWGYRPPAAVPLRAGGNPLPCPYGQTGDRLWVRETWQGPLLDYGRMDEAMSNHERFQRPEFCKYAADGGPAPEFLTADDDLVWALRNNVLKGQP